MSNYIIQNGELYHAHKSSDWQDHKYIAKVPIKSGLFGKKKYRYFYTREEYQAYLNEKKQPKFSIKLPTLKKPEVKTVVKKQEKKPVKKKLTVEEHLTNIKNKTISTLDTAVNEGLKFYNKMLNDDNIYNVHSRNYDKKIKEIEKTQEWQDIVKRKDPEYVKKNDDGTETHKIDDYLMKKKHPELDILDDVMNGRKISVNKITKDTVVAGIKDYAFASVRSGVLVAGIGAKFLMEKFKFSQGSYDDEVKELSKQIRKGADAASEYTDNVKSIAKESKEFTERDVMPVVEVIKNANNAAKTTSKKPLTDKEIVEIVKTMQSSDMYKSLIEDNDSLETINSLIYNTPNEDLEALLSGTKNAANDVNKAYKQAKKGDVLSTANTIQSNKEVKKIAEDSELLKELDEMISQMSDEDLQRFNEIVKAVTRTR